MSFAVAVCVVVMTSNVQGMGAIVYLRPRGAGVGGWWWCCGRRVFFHFLELNLVLGVHFENVENVTGV